jgi:hypothetical protein
LKVTSVSANVPDPTPAAMKLLTSKRLSPTRAKILSPLIRSSISIKTNSSTTEAVSGGMAKDLETSDLVAFNTRMWLPEISLPNCPKTYDSA